MSNEYTRAEFERDRMGETGERNAEARKAKAMTAPRYTAREFDELAKAFDGIHGYAATYNALRQAAETERQDDALERFRPLLARLKREHCGDTLPCRNCEELGKLLEVMDRRFGRTP